METLHFIFTVILGMYMGTKINVSNEVLYVEEKVYSIFFRINNK